LGGQVSAVFWKHAHPAVGKRVKQIHATYEEAGDAYEKKIVAVHHAAGVPCYCKDCESYDNAENLDCTVKKQIVEPA
jgi:hypothetical protein